MKETRDTQICFLPSLTSVCIFIPYITHNTLVPLFSFKFALASGYIVCSYVSNTWKNGIRVKLQTTQTLGSKTLS